MRRNPKLLLWFAAAICWSASASPLLVEVKEAASAHPLAGAKIILTTGAKSLLGTTGADGLCQFDAAVTNNTRLDVEKDGWCPMRWDVMAVPLPGSADRFTFPMQRATTIGGRVLDETKAPIARARVYVNFPQPLLGPHIPLEDPVVTDFSGHWEAAFVPATADFFHLDVIDPEYKWDAIQPGAKELRAGTAVLTMELLSALRGRVLDPSGQPVAGATVYRGEEWGIMGWDEDKPSVKTGADGVFRFQTAEAGTAQLAAIAAGYGGAIQTVSITQGMAPVELRLTAPQLRRFRVTGLAGKPIVNMNVKVSDWETFRYPPWEFKTDAEGRFTFSNAPKGELKMDFRAPGHMDLVMRPVSETEDEQLIQLGPALRLHGKVTDARTGQPVPEFKVTPGWPRQIFRDGALTNEGGEWSNPRQAKTFKHGEYDWTFNQPLIVGTAKPYDFLLRVEADGYGPAISRVFKATEGEAAFDFALGVAKYLTGSLRFSDGSPATGAILYLKDDRRFLPFVNGALANGRMGTATLPVDQNAQFKWIQQADAVTFLAWHERGFAEFTPDDLERSNTITLTRWSAVEGMLWRGDHVAANESVALCFNPKEGKRNGRFMARPGPFYNYEAKTDDQGRFIFDKVPPGEVAVARVEPITRPPRFGMPIGDVWAGCRLAVVKAPEGGHAQVKAGGFGRAVMGKLVSTNNFANCIADLTPMLPPIPYPDGLDDAAKQKWVADWFWSEAGQKYRIWYGGTPQVESFRQFPHSWAVNVAADGSFQIDDVPAGDYTLSANFRDPSDKYPGMAMRLGRNAAALTYKFTVPPGDDLPTLPALELGTIGETKPAPEIEVDVAEPSAQVPVTVGISSSPRSVQPGQFFDVLVRARIAEGHHIYAANPFSTNVFIPTTAKLTLPEGVEAVSDWITPAVSRAKDRELIYTNSIVFHQSLKVNPKARPGPVSIKGELRCQACNDQLCWPPKNLPFSTAVTIEPSSKGTP
jgi:hypothetical protein